LLLSGILIGVAIYFIVDEPVPAGTNGVEAEELTDEMLRMLNKKAYDTLEYVEFTFRGEHDYQWDRLNNTVTVMWDEQSIYLDLNKGQDSYNLLEFKAYEYFLNDSFWLVAPFKIRDNGVIRSVVDLDEGRGLLVTYTT